MPQTLLAIAALVMATTFVVQHQRTSVTLRAGMVRTELGLQATAVAVDVLEEMGTTAFDEAVAGGAPASSPAVLTPAGRFGPGDTPHNDLDDFAAATFRTFRAWDGDTLWFGVETDVSYADEAAPAREVVGPTRYKKAAVRVYSLDAVRPDTVRLWQAYACGSRCSW